MSKLTMKQTKRIAHFARAGHVPTVTIHRGKEITIDRKGRGYVVGEKEIANIKQLYRHLNLLLDPSLKPRMVTESITPDGGWNTAKDWIPEVTIDQLTREVIITRYETSGYQNQASVETDWCEFELSWNDDQMYVRAEVSCTNWANYKCSGSQTFCLAVFVGDSDHVYLHRAPATKGWMQGDPSNIRRRLRKLGIGALRGVLQQGDFLLKPANGNAYDDEAFKHESMGAGHHKFECPVLYATGRQGRQYLVTEPVTVIHHAVDGIQHPDLIVPPGIWVVGSTADSLTVQGWRD